MMMDKIKKLYKDAKHMYLYISAFAKVREYMIVIDAPYMGEVLEEDSRVYRAILWTAAYRNKKDSVYNALHKVGIV